MKKQLKSIIQILILSLAVTLLASCGYEPVFYGIMHDVLPEEATVSGNITSIARCTIDSKEYLFVSGGGALSYKPLDSAQHGDWKSTGNLPFSMHRYNYYPSDSTPEGHIGQQILKVISDKDYIYLLSTSYTTDTEYGIVLPETFYIWTCPLSKVLSAKSSDWTNITKGNESLFATKYNSSAGLFETYFSFFMTNSPKAEHRKAFFVCHPSAAETKYYVLNGTGALTPVDDITTIGQFITVKDENTRANSAFYLGDTLYFSDSQVVTTNETAAANATYACLAGMSSTQYSNSVLYTFDGTQKQELLSVDTSIASLALTADSLLIGKGSYSSSSSNGGIDRVLIDETTGMPLDTPAAFTTNAKYQFTSSYILMSLLCADPTKNEEEASLYAAVTYRGTSSASSASFENIGLWSYYPGRGNWNRE